MNKIKLFIMAAVLLFSGAAMGQKAAYINVNQLIPSMPEIPHIDSLLQRYQVDTVNKEFQSVIEQYNYKDSMLTKTDTTKIPPALRRQYRQDLEGLGYQIQNWQAISQQAVQAKQDQLLAPVYRKVMNAIQAVAKEKGYTYVYDKSALIVAPNGDDLLVPVAQRLNVKLAPDATPGLGR